MKPYIGICDFVSHIQVRRLLKLIPAGFSHDLMVGVMMSYKTLNDIPTEWASVFPNKELIASIMSICDSRVMNTIHYADYSVGKYADPNLAETLLRVQSYGGQYLGAIQLDMIWPDPTELKIFRRDSSIPIVLQIGRDAMAICKDDPIAVCDRLQTYGDAIAYVLFDKSMGRGMGMDATLLAQYVGALVADCPHLLPAVGGGLGPTSMHLVESLVRAYPGVSLDMQSKVRPSGDIHDPMDIDMAETALAQSIRMYQEKSK